MPKAKSKTNKPFTYLAGVADTGVDLDAIGLLGVFLGEDFASRRLDVLMMDAPEVVSTRRRAVLARAVRVLQRTELQLAGNFPDEERPATLAESITICLFTG